MQRIVLLGLAMLLVDGCAGRRAASPKPAPAAVGMPESSNPSTETNRSSLIVTPATQLQGKIALVNPTARYVVVHFPIGLLPAIDQRMPVYRNGLKVAEIKISGPQRDFNIAADIVAGDCQVGDEVKEK